MAPPATLCTHQCHAQNQTRGQSTVLGAPFPVADADRLKPRLAQYIERGTAPPVRLLLALFC